MNRFATTGLAILPFCLMGLLSMRAEAGLAAQPAWPILQGQHCGAGIAALLETWEARHETIEAANGPLGARMFKIPTARLGVWIVLQLDRDGSVRAVRVSSQQTELASWTAACEGPAHSAEQTELPGAQRENVFSDADLEALLQRRGSGVIYLWSPHMPLSVSGFSSIGRATKRLGIALVPLLDPLADSRYAATTITDEALPSDSARPVASVELLFRDLTTHAPSIQVFTNGRLVGDMLPGYRDPDYYVTYIERQLAR